MRHIKKFDKFLDETVNLNAHRIQTLESRVDSIKSFLRSSTYTPRIREFSAQGSWAHKTIIKPQKSKEFDADLVIFVDPVDDWSAKDYIVELRRAFRESSVYRDKAGFKTRCVTIDYAKDFHLDVVPIVYDPNMQATDVENWVCNRADNDYEMSDGKGFKEWWAGREAIVTGHYLRKAARIIKYIRDTKGTFSAKSVLLTTLIGMQIEDGDSSDAFTDVPTTLKIVLERLDTWLQARPYLPEVENPALEGESFTRNWTQDQYDNFRSKIGEYATWAAEAYDEQNRDESIRKWRRLLGNKFAKGETSDRAKQAVRKLAEELAYGVDLVSAVLSRGTQMLSRIPQNLPHVEPVPYLQAGQQVSLVVKATERKSRGTAALRTLQSGEPIPAHRGIEFQAIQGNGLPLPTDYKVVWQVVNTDEAAANANSLRGGFENSDTHGFRYEGTLYRGVHWVQAFAINRRTNRLVGTSDRFFVVIT